MKRCHNCLAELMDEARFCPKCGSEQHKLRWCTHCGSELKEKDVFCPKCGKKVFTNPSSAILSKDLFSKYQVPIGLFLFIAVLSCVVLVISSKSDGTQNSTGFAYGHEWVDLGLSVKWATCNIGASSPEEKGDYFAWGETSTKPSYDWENCFDCLDNEGEEWSIYKLDGQTEILPESGHDAARENWGFKWRLPTEDEFKELNEMCTWVWTSKGGRNGYEVTGPNGNSIFLPADGYCNGTEPCCGGEQGYYWSSTLYSCVSHSASGLYFNCSCSYKDCYFSRKFGHSVRPVIG